MKHMKHCGAEMCWLKKQVGKIDSVYLHQVDGGRQLPIKPVNLYWC